MTTVRELITDALKRIQVLAAGEDPKAEEAADGLTRFNQLMDGLALESIDVDWATLTLDNEIPLPRKHIRGVMHLLAVELAPEYGKEVDPAIAVIAQQAHKLLQAEYTDVREITFDRALRRRDTGTGGWSIDSED